jgi:predicted Fe-Mo cluster-binding NifX family protein
MTKFAVPIIADNGMASEVNEHFGMSEFFLVLEVDGDKIASTSTLQDNPSIEGHKPPAEFLADNDVQIVLAGGIGPHMIQILLDRGLRIFKGAAGTVEDAWEDYKAGMLTEVRTAGDME